MYDANEVHALTLSGEALDYCCSTETVKNTFVYSGKVVLFHYEGPEIEKRKKMILTLPGFCRKYDETDDNDLFVPQWVEMEREEWEPVGGIRYTLQDPPPWKRGRIDNRPPPCVQPGCQWPEPVARRTDHPTEDSPPRKRGRGRPKKPMNPVQLVHRDDKKKKRKR